MLYFTELAYVSYKSLTMSGGWEQGRGRGGGGGGERGESI